MGSTAADRALAAICDTFVPSGDGLPSASELGVPEALRDAMGRNPRASERRQVGTLLRLWNTRLLTALGGAGPRRFSSLDQAAREKVLLAWAESGSAQRRAAFQAFRKAVLTYYYMLTAPDGGPNPVWRAIGFPGPLGTVENPPPRALHPLEVTSDTELDCDVCIVGSGAGGGTAAGVLASAGLDVIVLEAGEYFDDADFDGSELNALPRSYLPSPLASADQSVGLVAGSCLGGGTVVNYTTSFRTPDDVREEWAAAGIPAFTSEEYGRSLDAVCERLGVNLEHNAPSTRDQVMQEGLTKLGWHADRMPRNVRGCDQGRSCGYCGLGCRLGAKQSVAKTWLVDAEQAGARLFIRTRAEKVTSARGRATGVQARTADGHAVTVRSRAVVAACGALHTPALLRRSGLRNPHIGDHLTLHPAAAVFGVFDRELEPWHGTMQAIYSDEHRYLDGGYGVKYETASLQPHLFLAFSPWRGGTHHRRMMDAFGQTTPIGVLLRDRDGGRVDVGRDGEPVIHYRLSGFDAGHLRTGLDGAAQIFEAAGARRIFSSHTAWVSYDPGTDGDRERFMSDADAAGYGPGRIALNSFHLMGSARMGGSSSTSACSPTGETWETGGLYVADGSAFPASSGVNPMISIESIAHMTARGIAASLA